MGGGSRCRQARAVQFKEPEAYQAAHFSERCVHGRGNSSSMVKGAVHFVAQSERVENKSVVNSNAIC